MSIITKFLILVLVLFGTALTSISGGMAHGDETEEYVPLLRLSTDNSPEYDRNSKVNYDAIRWERRAESDVDGSSVQLEGFLGSIFNLFTATKERVSPIVSPCYDSETRFGNVRTNVNVDVDPNFEDYSIKARWSFSRRDNRSAGCS